MTNTPFPPRIGMTNLKTVVIPECTYRESRTNNSDNSKSIVDARQKHAGMTSIPSLPAISGYDEHFHPAIDPRA
jgi:hypothetical protein